MDNKEAIYYLQYLRHDVHANSPYDVAIVTAIKALSETKPPKTNADRIRQMTDEELCEFMAESICNSVDSCRNDTPCSECRLAWLKQEVSEDAGTD